jgi:tRNA1Val (adenine37-N6)-methyltransferase
MEEQTLDEILNGQLRVFQNKKGYRFSIDSILLSNFIALKPRAHNIELGCGNGIIILALAKRFPQHHFKGLEIQENLALLAQKNIRLNALENRINIVSGDARKISEFFPARSFDNVFFNPPYRKLNSGRVNSHQEKAIAKHEITGSLEDFLRASTYLLKSAGSVFSIYPAKRLAELIYLFRKNGIEPKKMKMVFSDMISDAEFVLMQGRKDAGEELQIEPPLILYDKRRKYTPEVIKIFKEIFPVPSDGDG